MKNVDSSLCTWSSSLTDILSPTFLCLPLDGDVGSSRGAKGEKYTLQELQGKTNKALMVGAP